RPAGVREGEADRGRKPRADRAEIPGMIRVAARNEAPDELRRASRADDDRLFVSGLLERAVNVPLIDGSVRAEFARGELVEPRLFLPREALEARGILVSLAAPK